MALIEFSSIALGTRASDAMLKKATVSLLRAGTVQPGKYVILLVGQVAAVDESYLEGLRVGAEAILDRVFLPEVAEAVHAAVMGRRGDWSADTLGVIETATLAATIEAADAAVKGANVEMVQIRLGDGLHGKGLAHFAGSQADVEAAIQIGSERIAYKNQQVLTAVIPRLAGDLRSVLSQSTFFEEGD